jgi:di/tricarboxylate transporter
MTWEIIFVFALLLFAVVSFSLEKIPTDLTAILVFAVLLSATWISGSAGLPSLPTLFDVFSNPAPITIAAMFIVSAALDKCGAIDSLAQVFKKGKNLPYPGLILLMVLFVGFVSAFINNTPVVVVLLPAMLSLAREMNLPASKLLIPLSYASIMGGTCTLLGTSTNILASGIIADSGQPPLGMFELGKVGLPLVFFGTLYLGLLGNRLLPVRETLTQILSPEERREYLTEAFVRPDSPMIGKTLADAGFKRSSGIRVMEVIRDGVAVSGDFKAIELHQGDRMVLACRPHGIVKAGHMEGMDLVGEIGEGLEQIAAQEGALVEGVIGPKSTIVGKTIKDINFRQRFRMIIVAVHREGENLRDQLGHLQLKFGDTLLMMGTDKAIENLRRSDDILLLDRPRVQTSNNRRKMPIVIATVVGIVSLNTFKLLPIEASVILGVAVLFLTDCLKPKEGYAAIDWSILLLIFGMLALGSAMHSSGATIWLADLLTHFSSNPWLMLAALYLVTAILTETLSNNATIVLMAPIAIELANKIGIDPRPFIITCCIASSASFSTPIGYQTNTYVYGVGGYKFLDFARIGIGLSFTYFVFTVLLVPRIWSF